MPTSLQYIYISIYIYIYIYRYLYIYRERERIVVIWPKKLFKFFMNMESPIPPHCNLDLSYKNFHPTFLSFSESQTIISKNMSFSLLNARISKSPINSKLYVDGIPHWLDRRTKHFL